MITTTIIIVTVVFKAWQGTTGGGPRVDVNGAAMATVPVYQRARRTMHGGAGIRTER